jgi:hypothetical protein
MPKDKHKIDEDSTGDLANEHAIGNVPKEQTTLVINMLTRFKFIFVNEYFNHYETIISSSLEFLSTIIMQPIMQPFTLIFVHDPRQEGYDVENCLPSQSKHWILSNYT